MTKIPRYLAKIFNLGYMINFSTKFFSKKWVATLCILTESPGKSDHSNREEKNF